MCKYINSTTKQKKDLIWKCGLSSNSQNVSFYFLLQFSPLMIKGWTSPPGSSAESPCTISGTHSAHTHTHTRPELPPEIRRNKRLNTRPTSRNTRIQSENRREGGKPERRRKKKKIYPKARSKGKAERFRFGQGKGQGEKGRRGKKVGGKSLGRAAAAAAGAASRGQRRRARGQPWHREILAIRNETGSTELRREREGEGG